MFRTSKQIWARLLSVATLPVLVVGCSSNAILFETRSGTESAIWGAPDGAAPQLIIDAPGSESSPIWAPGRKRFAYISDGDRSAEIYVAFADGTGVMRITNTSVDESMLAWAPGGKRLAYVSPDADGLPRVYWVDLEDLLPHRLAPDGIGESDPAWAPNGNWIATATVNSRREPTGLVLRSPNGVGERKVTSQPASQPAWSHDGERLAFRVMTDGVSTIEMVDVSSDGRTSPPRLMSSGMGPSELPLWSPDNTELAYLAGGRGHRDLIVTDLSGQTPRSLTNSVSDVTGFAWSKDNRIAFAVHEGDASTIHVVNRDGSQTQRSLDGAWSENPRW